MPMVEANQTPADVAQTAATLKEGAKQQGATNVEAQAAAMKLAAEAARRPKKPQQTNR